MTRDPAPGFPRPLLPTGRMLVVGCFFLSGATSLVFQVAWSKMLGVVLGNTMYAITTVVAAYMAGLGLGSFLGGRVADRLRGRFRLYGAVEGAVGLFGLASPWIFHGLEPVFGWLYDPAAGSGSPLLLARFGVLFLVMMVPTLAMGCTLPLLVAFLQGHGASFGRHVGRLYAVNTLGAVTGTWLAGFALIPAVGLRATVLIAGAANLVLMAVVWGSRLPEAPPGAGRAPESGPRTAAVSAAAARVVLPLFAVSGALALTYELAWTRSLAVVLGSSTYSFSTILGTYLLGIGLGSLLVAPRVGRWRRPMTTLAVLQALLGASVVAGTFAIPRLGALFGRYLQLRHTAEEGVGAWAVFGGSLMTAAIIVLLPSILLGAIFPGVVSVVHRAEGRPGRSVGRAYGLNTVGTIVGSLLTGFLLLERLGVQRTLLWSGAGTFAVGAVFLVLASGARGRRLAVAVGMLVVGPAMALLTPAWNPAETNAGVARILRTVVFRDLGLDALPLTDIVYAEEGRQASVVVTRLEEQTTLWVSGKPDASDVADLPTMVLTGQIPMMLARDPRDVLIIGHGSGVTAGSVLTHPVESVLTVEIEPAVLRASRFFHATNGKPLLDPRHATVLEDGRTWLQYAGRTYDVIISEPSNPWIAGIGNLFTRDYYEQVRESLRDGGVFCQWLQLYEFRPETAWSIVRALVDVFEDAEVFVARDRVDALLVARRGGLSMTHALLAESMSRPAVAADLRRVGIRDPFDLSLRYRGRLARFLPPGGGPVNTDDNAYVEFRAPRDLFRGRGFRGLELSPDEALETARSGLFPDLDAETALAGYGVALARAGRLEEAERLEAYMTRQGWETVAAVRDAFVEALSVDAELRPHFWTLRRADRAAAGGDHRAALAAVREVRARLPRHPIVAMRLGVELLTLGMKEPENRARHLEEAARLFGALAQEPPESDDYEALINLGLVQVGAGRVEDSLGTFREAARRDPQRPDAWLQAGRAARALGDAAEARRLYEEGRRRVPGHPEITAELEALGPP